jgi:hypothetical protein
LDDAEFHSPQHLLSCQSEVPGVLVGHITAAVREFGPAVVATESVYDGPAAILALLYRRRIAFKLVTASQGVLLLIRRIDDSTSHVVKVGTQQQRALQY